MWEEGCRTEEYWQKWLEDKPFTTLFVDGNHENHDLLDAMPVAHWRGGKVHFVRDSVIHLMRGQVFDIGGQRFFTMGGAASHDKQYRTEVQTWWRRELPSQEEMDEGLRSLERVGFQVDYILTHTPPPDILYAFYPPEDDKALCAFLGRVGAETTYRHWFFGHIHRDERYDERHTAVYRRIIPLDSYE